MRDEKPGYKKPRTSESESLRSEGELRRERDHRLRMKNFIPLLIIAGFAVFIARQEIPAFASWLDKLLDAEAWTAAEACRKAVKATTANPGFARLTDNGTARKTDAGYFIEDVEYTVLDKSGKEYSYTFGCNVTPDGEVVSIRGEGTAPNAQ